MSGRYLWSVLVEQQFVQASPIKDFAAFRARREVLFFLGWQLLVVVGCHDRSLVHNTSVHLAERKGLRSSAKKTDLNSGCIFCDQLLKGWTVPQRVEHRIEPEQRRSKRRVCGQWASARYRE